MLLEEDARRKSRRWLDTLYPDTGPLRRELYPKHTAFFKAGAQYRTRLFMAARPALTGPFGREPGTEH